MKTVKTEVSDHQLKVTCENHKGGQIKFQGLCNIFNQDGTISSEEAEGSRDEGFQASKCINLNVSIPSFRAHFFLIRLELTIQLLLIIIIPESGPQFFLCSGCKR